MLAAGGYNNSYPAAAELYDPAAGAWSATGSMATDRTSQTVTLLPNGLVLVVGGQSDVAATSSGLEV